MNRTYTQKLLRRIMRICLFSAAGHAVVLLRFSYALARNQMSWTSLPAALLVALFLCGLVWAGEALYELTHQHTSTNKKENKQ